MSGTKISEIRKGILCLVGVTHVDTADDVSWCVGKLLVILVFFSWMTLMTIVRKCVCGLMRVGKRGLQMLFKITFKSY